MSILVRSTCVVLLGSIMVLAVGSVRGDVYGDFESVVDLNQIIYTPENAPQVPKLEELALTDSITQYGITWKLDKEVRVGRFITGDYYVVGPVSVVSRSPNPLFGQEVKDAGWTIIDEKAVREETKHKGKYARNGSILNLPVDTRDSGVDSRIAHGVYNYRLFQRPPFKLRPGDSLIASVSNEHLEILTGHGQPVLSYAVLTCMAEPQPADAFRPSYADKTNRIYLARNLRRDLMFNLPIPKSAPKIELWIRRFMRPWVDTVAWGYAGAKNNQPRYGKYYADAASRASLMLHLDYPAMQREKLLIHYVQYGIDLGGIMRAGFGGYMGHGGFGGGRKWTIIFAGLLLGDEEMRNPGKSFPTAVFGEDTQTAVGKSWTGQNVVFTSHPRWTNPKTSSPELVNPNQWAEVIAQTKRRNGFQNDGYRRCCTSIVWGGQALSARMMGAEEYWNHDPFFAYVDRWMQEEDIHATAKVVADAAKSSGRKSGPRIQRQKTSDPFIVEMWAKYRTNLP